MSKIEEVLHFAMSVCEIGKTSESLDIERIAVSLAVPQKGLIRVMDYKARLEGKRVPDRGSDIRLDHWEAMATDITATMVAKAIYDNICGMQTVQGRNIADVIWDDLEKAKAVFIKDGRAGVNLYNFTLYVKKLAEWVPSEFILSNGILFNDKIIKMDKKNVKICSYMKKWLHDVLVALQEGRTNEVNSAFEIVAEGLAITRTGIPFTMGKQNTTPTSVKKEPVDEMVLRNHYIVVARDKDENVRIKKTDSFYTACAMQIAMLTGKEVKELIPDVKEKKEGLKEVAKNLLASGRDRIANDTQEVYIFLVRGRKQFR